MLTLALSFICSHFTTLKPSTKNYKPTADFPGSVLEYENLGKFIQMSSLCHNKI